MASQLKKNMPFSGFRWMKIDVAVCTYQSERYLDECLTSVEKSVPINKLIVVDHYSTDKTIEIAKKDSLRKRRARSSKANSHRPRRNAHLHVSGF